MTIVYRERRIVAHREPMKPVRKPNKSEVQRILIQLEEMRRDALAEYHEIEGRKQRSNEAATAFGRSEAYALAAQLVAELL